MSTSSMIVVSRKSTTTKIKKRPGSSIFINFPDEIITKILSMLPMKSIYRFKSVSKKLCSLFSNPYFIKLHSTRPIQQDEVSLILIFCNKVYSIDHDSLTSNKPGVMTDHNPFISLQSYNTRLVGSCNGLICFTSGTHYRHSINLWNPFTDEYKQLPSPPPPIVEKDLPYFKVMSCGIGLGYDYEADDYKILRIVSMLDDRNDNLSCSATLYSLRSGSWKAFLDIPCVLILKSLIVPLTPVIGVSHWMVTPTPGILVNGALHWIATPKGQRATYYVIVSFDMVDEIFKEVPVPKDLSETFSTLSLKVGVLKEWLCLFDNIWNVRTDVWVMKEYGVSESWTKLFTIPIHGENIRFFWPLKCLENGDMLLIRDAEGLDLYDTQKRTTITKLSTSSNIEGVTCVKSLLSLNSGTYLKEDHSRDY